MLDLALDGGLDEEHSGKRVGDGGKGWVMDLFAQHWGVIFCVLVLR